MIISVTQAMEILKGKGIPKTRATIINWCVRFGVGHQPGDSGPWFVNKEKLLKHIEGPNGKED